MAQSGNVTKGLPLYIMVHQRAYGCADTGWQMVVHVYVYVCLHTCLSLMLDQTDYLNRVAELVPCCLVYSIFCATRSCVWPPVADLTSPQLPLNSTYTDPGMSLQSISAFHLFLTCPTAVDSGLNLKILMSPVCTWSIHHLPTWLAWVDNWPLNCTSFRKNQWSLVQLRALEHSCYITRR